MMPITALLKDMAEKFPDFTKPNNHKISVAQKYINGRNGFSFFRRMGGEVTMDIFFFRLSEFPDPGKPFNDLGNNHMLL